MCSSFIAYSIIDRLNTTMHLGCVILKLVQVHILVYTASYDGTDESWIYRKMNVCDLP